MLAAEVAVGLVVVRFLAGALCGATLRFCPEKLETEKALWAPKPTISERVAAHPVRTRSEDLRPKALLRRVICDIVLNLKQFIV